MTDQNPIGVLAQMQGAGEAAENAFIEHCVKANYATVSIMDNFGLCSRLKDRLSNCVVIHRDSNFEPMPSGANSKTIADYLLKQPADKRIVIMVNCEAGFSTERVKMWSDFLPVADAMGWKLCVGNTSSGSVRSGQGTDANEWLTIGAPLLKALYEHPGHYLGYHNYTSVFMWLVSNGGWGDPLKGPDIDWSKPQWHIGRDLQGITAACQVLGIELPQMIVTEGLFDQMNDTQNNPDNPYHGISSNRWRMLAQKWAEWYPGKSAEDVLADQSIWAWEHLFAPRKKIIGVHVFTYLSPVLASGQWSGDDVANAPIYLKRMETYRPTPEPPMPLPSMPKPSNANDKHRMKATQDVELLTGPAAGYALKGVIHAGFEVDMWNTPSPSDRGVYYKWAEGRTGPMIGLGGWVRDDVNWQEVKKATSEVPPVITDSPPTSGTINPVTPVVVNPPVEALVRYRMQIITFKEVSLPPSVAKTLIEAGVSLEAIA